MEIKVRSAPKSSQLNMSSKATLQLPARDFPEIQAGEFKEKEQSRVVLFPLKGMGFYVTWIAGSETQGADKARIISDVDW